ncbi:MAG: M28 family metallopeptidase [Candidatus Hodarchaeales archaeon]|jgi:acetylornithine deacetylase/succinyl-diaminopimelate desuccinylase-like protein
MIELISDICSQVGPRASASPAEKEAGDYIEKEFAQFCDTTAQEEFELHPRAFLDFIWITFGFFLLAVVAYPFFPLLTAIFIACGFFLFFAEQMLLWEPIDRFFPKKSSTNVIGKISSAKESKGTVILSAHHDSSFEFTLLRHLGKRSTILISTTVALGVIAALLAFLKALSLELEPSLGETIDLFQFPILGLAFLLLFLLALTLHSSRVVMGANDNLSGVTVIIEAGKKIAQNRPDHCDVWLVSFGCEEVGMRGSKHFVEQHMADFQGPHDFLLNLDNVGAGTLHILSEEKMALTKYTEASVEMAEQAAAKAGHQVPTIPYDFAHTDACRFAKKNLNAVSIIAMGSHGMPVNWHSRTDVPEELDASVLEQTLEITLEFVKGVDGTIEDSLE